MGAGWVWVGAARRQRSIRCPPRHVPVGRAGDMLSRTLDAPPMKPAAKQVRGTPVCALYCQPWFRDSYVAIVPLGDQSVIMHTLAMDQPGPPEVPIKPRPVRCAYLVVDHCSASIELT